MEQDKLITVKLPHEHLPRFFESLGDLATASSVEISVSDIQENANQMQLQQESPAEAEVFNSSCVSYIKDEQGNSRAVVTRGELESFELTQYSGEKKAKQATNFHFHLLELKQLSSCFFKLPQNNAKNPYKNVGIIASEYNQFVALIEGPFVHAPNINQSVIDFFKAFQAKLHNQDQDTEK